MGVLLLGTAMAAVNAIPSVCTAPSGFTTPACAAGLERSIRCGCLTFPDTGE
jgi:hypothetical protein